MNRRISLLVAIGFALLLALGVLVSVIIMGGLKQTVVRAQDSQASALSVRAAVRSLRADYLEASDVVSRVLLDPRHGDPVTEKQRADMSADQHLASATAATHREDLKDLLKRLQAHDAAVTNRVEDQLLSLATTDANKAKSLYLTRFLRARAVNMTLVDRALKVASEEVTEAGELTETEATRTLLLAWVTLDVFVIVGLTSGLLLSGAVRTIAKRFEKAAGEITQQRDHLQAVTTAMRDGLIVVDAAGIITTVNSSTCTLLGYEREELIGSTIGRFIKTAPTMPAESAGLRPHTDTFCAHDGSDIPISISAATLRDAAGEIVGTVMVAHDIRDHLRMLSEISAARDAALEGSRIKSEFLANMSHEIRTPMNVIIGYVDIMLESEVAAAHREYLDRVRRATVDLLDVINDVLDLSKVEAGKLSLERVPLDVRLVVDHVIRTLILRAQEKRLPLSVEMDPTVPGRIMGDPTRLRQVILNLVSNAIKFTEQGEVTVKVTREHAGGTSMLRFAVSDTGIGIPPEKQDLIFQAFTQADGSMSRRFGGTGLGLTIAARLVTMMGGRIAVESTVGKGSVFHFAMPAEACGDGLAA